MSIPTSIALGAPANVSQLREAIADAHAARTPLRIEGSGTWLHGGRPVQATHTIHTRGLRDVVAYVPGDLVITVGAGMTLGDLRTVTGEHGQWLALDPPGGDDATIGAIVATASSGPLALGMGRVRDLVLGVSTITGDGTPVHAGGRVVKNVAGFDLVRLSTGAFGTLGVITEASFRLHARPAVDETFALSLDPATDLQSVPARLGLPALQFLALELLDETAARAIDALDGTRAREHAGGSWTLLARASGNRARVNAQRALLAPLGPVHQVDARTWEGVRMLDASLGPHAICFRVADAPARFGNTVREVQTLLAAQGVRGARLRATPHAGVVRVAVAESNVPSVTALVAALQAVGASRVVEQLPASAWADVAGAAGDPISVRLRDVFDPHRLLNPGILGEPLS